MASQINLAELCNELSKLSFGEGTSANIFVKNKSMMAKSVIFSLPKIVKNETDKLKALVTDGLLEQEVADEISNLFRQLHTHECDICGMIGHVRTHCWLNGQIYADARANPGLEIANSMWREAIKAKQKTKKLDAKRLAQQYLLSASARVNLTAHLQMMEPTKRGRFGAHHL